MKIQKIGITTGEPFAETGCIVFKEDTSLYKMYTKQGFWTNQESSYGQGVSKATLEEIKSNWSQIKDQWDPQPGDLVRITQGGYNETDDFVIEGQEGLSADYWSVSYLNGNAYTAFNKNQMVLSPNHGWEANSTPEAVTEPQPRWKVGDYVTYKSHDDCEGQKYNFGGSCQGGYKGRIIDYGSYIREFNCFAFTVRSIRGSRNIMLESEFKEWDNPNFQNSVKPEPVIDKKVEYTIRDRVLRFDGHEVRVGDCVSFNYPSDNKKGKDRFIANQRVLNVENDQYVGDLAFRTDSQWYNIRKVKDFVNHGQPHFKEPFKQPLKFKIYEKVLFITFNKGESGTIVKVDEEEEYFKYYVKLSSDNNVCVCGEKDIIPYSREEERALTIDTELDSLKSLPINIHTGQPAQSITSDIENSFVLVDSRLHIHDVYYPSLLINPIKKEKSVSDYQQKPVTLYKSKTKLSLKPIKL
jgi:hypothetical protein